MVRYATLSWGGGKYAQLIKVPTEFLTMSVVAYSCTCDFYRVVTWLLTAIHKEDKHYTGQSKSDLGEDVIETIKQRGDLYIGGGYTDYRFRHCSKEEAEKIDFVKELFLSNKLNYSQVYELSTCIDFFQNEFQTLDSKVLSIVRLTWSLK